MIRTGIHANVRTVAYTFGCLATVFWQWLIDKRPEWPV